MDIDSDHSSLTDDSIIAQVKQESLQEYLTFKYGTDSNSKYLLIFELCSLYSTTVIDKIPVTINSDSDEFNEYQPFSKTFGNHRPEVVEFTSFVPAYPKSHIKGYATIVELPQSGLSQEKVDKLKKAMQYMLTREGHGKKLKNHIEFFEIEDSEEEIPMFMSHRNCAGVKVC